MGKPTVHDIAKEAGVSLATVDRVLNARPGVREQTVERVQSAIQRLGYVRDSYAATLARRKEYRFVFILPERSTQFVEMVRAALLETTLPQHSERISVKVIHVAAHDPHEVVRALQQLRPRHFDGVALMVPETPQVRDAVAHLREESVAVVSLVTDLPNSERDHFVGIDNRAAGRTAGVLLGRFIGPRRGRVAVLVNTTQSRDMLERRAGFDEVMARDFPELEPLPSLEGHDDPVLAAQVVETCLDRHGQVVGIYSAGAGTRGLTRALRDRGLEREVVVIAHETTPHNQSALRDGTIDALIAQNVGHLVRSAIRVLRAKTDGAAIFEAQERIRIDILIRENLP